MNQEDIYYSFQEKVHTVDEEGRNVSTENYVLSEINKFKEDLHLVDDEPIIDYILSTRKKEQNATAVRNFETDDSNHIKVLVAIDMLNEGVHLEGVKGSFNNRRIDGKQQGLLTQHLGRVIFSIDPDKELREEDIPVVFDKFNNYSNLDMERRVNKTNSTSDLEKLKDIIFWINKYGYIPQTDAVTDKEKKKAITLRKIQRKYEKYIDTDIDKLTISIEEKHEIKEILRLGKEINLWNIEFTPVTQEEVRKIDRVNIFNVSATEKKFLELYNSIYEVSNEKTESKDIRLTKVLKVLDYLAEANVELTPDTIENTTTLKQMLRQLDPDIQDDILYELKRNGINEDYIIGINYYFARDEFRHKTGLFSNFESSAENIINFRKYGILINSDNETFTNKYGFIISGPKKYQNKNIWTGTYYDEEGYNAEGIDIYGFNRDGINQKTNTKYDLNGFDCNHIHKDTNDIYDRHGFDISRIHKVTGTKLDERFFDIEGYWYKENDFGQRYRTFSRYADDSFDIDGYNKYGFDRNGIHSETHKEYNPMGFDVEGYYWKEEGKKRVKTENKLNENNFDYKGHFYEKVNGKLIDRGPVYDSHGFYFNGIHYKTNKYYDERGFDKDGYWYKQNADGEYINTHSKYNDKGFDIDRLTIRHNVYGIPFRDYVDEHGFDEYGFYHMPVVGPNKNGLFDSERIPFIQEEGFRNYISGTIYYAKRARSGKNKYHDAHGFDVKGIHRSTGTKLNPKNFDIDGYYYIEKDGEFINTGKLHNEYGFTIDNKVLVRDKSGYHYESRYKGFDADGRYKTGKYYNEYGFTIDGTHYETGTKLDPRNFDADGYYYKENEQGELINTGSKFDEDGWSQNKTHISTKTTVDKHGFNYMHLYVKRTNNNKRISYEAYDKHGFDYKGIHKTTGKKLNRTHFDIDGYWYKKVGKEYVKTDSKFDDTGLNIDRLDLHNFSKNGYYKGTRRKINPDGFNVNGIHCITNTNYDLNGKDIDGNQVELTKEEQEELKDLNEEIVKEQSKFLEELFEELNTSMQEKIIESYDVYQDYIEENEYVEYFLDLVEYLCRKDDDSKYTKEEVFDFIRELGSNKYHEERKDELDEIMLDYYRQMHRDGDMPDLDFDDIFRFKNY